MQAALSTDYPCIAFIILTAATNRMAENLHKLAIKIFSQKKKAFFFPGSWKPGEVLEKSVKFYV